MSTQGARGATLGQRYRLDELLGQGGFGQVWAATHLATLGRVALKILNGPLCVQPDSRVRFLREARAAAAVRHPNVVRVHEFFELTDGTPILAMDLLQGETLRAHLKRELVLPLQQAIDLLLPVVSALGTAHAAGVVHRDVKPDNVFLVSAGSEGLSPRVLDFGLAKLARGAALREGELETRSGEMLGTLGYMSPEQAFGAKDVDHRTDVWALGAMLYETLCGSRALGESIAHVMSHLVGQRAIVPLDQVVSGLPRDVAELIARMLSRDPAQRPEDLREVVRVLSVHSRIEAPPFGPALGVWPSNVSAESAAGSGPAGDAAAASAVLGDGKTFWSEAHGERCAYHTSEAGDRMRLERTALVFVQASLGHAGCSQRDLVRALLDAAQVELDALSTRVILDRADPAELERVTRDLSAEISARCPRHVSFIFIADALGMVVVKHLLEQEWPSETTDTGKARRRLIGFRTRSLVELALARPDGAPFDAALEPLAPALAARILDVDEAFAQHLQRIERACLPRPAYRRFEAQIAEGQSPASEATLVRRLAMLIDFPKYAAHQDILVAAETASRAFDLDRATHTGSLLGEPAPLATPREPAQVKPTLSYTVAGSQQDVRERVLAAFHLKSARPRRLVITGDAGVGKSTLVRRMARDMALELLEMGPAAPLPILMPLQQETLSAEELAEVVGRDAAARGRALFRVLARRWCDWANTLLADQHGSISLAWFERRLASLPTVLIYDGADEFLVNNAGLDIGVLRDFINFLFSEFGSNGRLDILVVLRSSQPGIRTLATNAQHIFEILSLTLEQATAAFPDVSALLAAIEDPDARRLVLTPLVLSWLGPRASRLAKRRLQTPAEVLEQALLAIVDESHLTELTAADREPTDAAEWLDALTLIAWVFYSKLVAQSSLEVLLLEAERLVSAWQRFSREHAEDEQSYLLVRGFRLARDEQTLGPLLRRSVFLPTGAGRVRFVHQEWLFFLTARYYARCVASGNADELRSVGIAPTIHRMAGDLLARDNVHVDLPLVRRILGRTRETGETLITANFNALLTSSRVPVEGSAIELLLASLDDMKPLAKFIALNGLGMRALRDDAAAGEFRSRLLSVFGAYVTSGEARDPVLVSIGWCYTKAFAKHFATRAPSVPWSFAESPETERDALAMMCSLAPDGPRLLPEHRSVQSAFLETQGLILKDACRPISVVHYLYLLVVSERHRASIDDVGRELPAILDPAGPIGRAILAYDVVPEVAHVYALCRRIYAARRR